MNNESKKLESIINSYAKTTGMIIGNSGLLDDLKDYGVNADYISRGNALLSEAKAVASTLKLNEEVRFFTNSYFVKMEHVQKRYCKYVKKLSRAAQSRPELLRIIPPVLDTISPSETLQTAFILYQNLMVMADSIEDILAETGITTAKLERELGLLGEIGYLKLVRYRDLDEDAQTVMELDQKIEQLLAYSKELKAIAFLALSRKLHLYPAVSKYLS